MTNSRRQRARLSLGFIALLAAATVGCLSLGHSKVPTPQFSNRSVRVQSPLADRMRQDRVRQAALTHQAASTKLPEELEPLVPSRPWTFIVLHHTATEEDDVASIDSVHRRRRDASGRPWLGIGYHFVIGNGKKMADGQIEATFRWHEQIHGAHAGTVQHNERGIGICLVGNFERHPPTPRQVAATKRLVKMLADRYGIGSENVIKHSDVKATACPGRLFPFDEIVDEVSGNRSASHKRRDKPSVSPVVSSR